MGQLVPGSPTFAVPVLFSQSHSATKYSRQREIMEKLSLLLVLCAVIGIEANGITRTAIAHLKNGVIEGNVTFIQEDSGPVRVEAIIVGLSDGDHGFHIHEKGDITTCAKAGGHYNPFGKSHGGPTASERHVGDLGNIVSNGSVATLNINDSQISLVGEHNIIGRAVVVHEKKDDLGLGGAADSKTTGNAGGRLVCGVIGIKDPVDNWSPEKSISTTLPLVSMGTLSLIATVLSTL